MVDAPRKEHKSFSCQWGKFDLSLMGDVHFGTLVREGRLQGISTFSDSCSQCRARVGMVASAHMAGFLGLLLFSFDFSVIARQAHSLSCLPSSGTS